MGKIIEADEVLSRRNYDFINSEDARKDWKKVPIQIGKKINFDRKKDLVKERSIITFIYIMKLQA